MLTVKSTFSTENTDKYFDAFMVCMTEIVVEHQKSDGGTFLTCTNIFFNFLLVSIIFLTNFFLFQLIIFPIRGSLHEFFSNFFGARIFFLSVSPARFLLPPSSPHHFSNGPPLTGHLGQRILFPAFPLEKMSHNTVQGVPKKYPLQK